jgi:hypothetical protein
MSKYRPSMEPAVRKAATQCEIAQQIGDTESPEAWRGSALEDVEKLVRRNTTDIEDLAAWLDDICVALEKHGIKVL